MTENQMSSKVETIIANFMCYFEDSRDEHSRTSRRQDETLEIVLTENGYNMILVNSLTHEKLTATVKPRSVSVGYRVTVNDSDRGDFTDSADFAHSLLFALLAIYQYQAHHCGSYCRSIKRADDIEVAKRTDAKLYENIGKVKRWSSYYL